MKVSVESTTDLQRRLTVELPRAGLTEKINERLDTLKGQASVEGFRPGKVPLDVVRNKFGARVQEEVCSEAINESLQQALDQEQLEPVGKPEVTIDESSPDSLFRYSATFEVMPQVDIQPVEQIRLVRPIVEITEADIDRLIETLRRQRLSWKPAGRPARAGDRVTIDYSGTVDGKIFPGAVAQGMPAILGESSLIPGFEDRLLGMAESDTATIEATIPDTFHARDLRGQRASFEVKVLGVEESTLPELNDVFFRSFGIHEGGLAAFRDQVRQNMEIELREKIIGTLKLAMLDQLFAMHPVTVPETLIQLEIERVKTAVNDSQGGPATDDEIAARARHRVTGGIILTAMARKLGVTATPVMVREKIEYLAQTYENPEEVVAWYYSSQEQLASVESMVAEEQLVDYVLEHGKVTDQPMSFAEMMDSRPAG